MKPRAAVASIVALILAAFWKLASMKGVVITDDIFASDLMNENFPYRFALGEALRAGHWPLWVRELYGGFPLLARSEAGVCYPLNIILFGLLRPYVALNLTILLTLITAGVGMYFYVREVGGDVRAGLLGGVAFAFSGFLIAHLKHLSIANGASWLPVALLLLERAVVRGASRPLILFALVFGLQHLCGNAQVAYYCGVLYLLYFPLRLRDHRRGTQADKAFVVRALAAFAAALALGSLVAAVQLIPTYQLVSTSQRAGGVTFEYASRFAYDPASFWTFLSPYSSGDVGNGTYVGKGIFWEEYGYVGVLTFLLAAYATVRGWRRSWHVRFFAMTAAVSYLLVLGPATPAYHLVFRAVPGMSYFRFPTRLLLITDLSVAALGALGLTRLVATLKWPRLSFIPALVVALTAADLLHAQLRQNPIVDMATWTRPPVTAEILRRDSSLFRTFCVGGTHAHRRAFQAANGWEGDLQPFVDQREFIQPSTNILYGLSTPNGYANLIPNYLVDVWGDQNRAGFITRTASSSGELFQPAPSFWKLMRMYNVKYLTSFWPFAPAPHLTPVGLYGQSYLYRNDDVLPRAHLVGGVTVVRDDPDALAALASDAFDPGRSVLLRALPPGYQATDVEGGSVDFLQYGTNDAELQVRSPRDAILILSDSYFPGWLADVDGRPTAIYRANVTQRAVVVPAGEHRVRFRFRPTTVVVGAGISLAALLILLAWFRRSSRSSECR